MCVNVCVSARLSRSLIRHNLQMCGISKHGRHILQFIISLILFIKDCQCFLCRFARARIKRTPSVITIAADCKQVPELNTVARVNSLIGKQGRQNTNRRAPRHF